MARKGTNTTLDVDLYKEIQVLAIKKGKNANDLIEEGMIKILQENGVDINYILKKRCATDKKK